MRDIREVLELYSREGLVDRVERILSCRHEAARYVLEADRRSRAVVYRTDCSPDTVSVSNIFYSREAVKRILGVSRDEDLYRAVYEAMERPSRIQREGSFREFYREYVRDITRLPALLFYERDGGRYFTSSIVIARDPREEVYNASIHRVMVLGPDKCVARIVPRHLYRIVTENRRLGRETPVAICFSPHPLVELAAALQPEYGVFELEVANTLMRGGLEVCRTPLYSLPVPCRCSHVIEARVLLEDVEEGPFTDILMTYDVVRRQPLISVDAVYVNREDYPFHVILPGGSEHQVLMGIGKEADIYYAVSRVVRSVKKVRLTRGGGGWLHAVVSIEKNHDGDGKNAIMAAFAAHPSLKMVIIVDSDIDPDDWEMVEWALATRFQASRGLVVVTGARLSSLDPSSRDGLGDKIGIDATVPLSERSRFERARIPG